MAPSTARCLLAILAAIAIAYLVLLSRTSPTAPASIAPKEVNVAGYVSKSGADIAYMEVSFTSVKSNSTYKAEVFSGVYTISLPNDDTYTVELLAHFVGYAQPWVYPAGTLDLDTNETSYRMDLTF